MGKKKKKNIITPAINENETAAHSKSNTSEVKTTGKKFKDNNRSTDDNQAEIHSPRNVTKETKDNDSHECIDIPASEQSSCTLQLEIIDAHLKLCIGGLIGCMKIAMCFSKIKNVNNFLKHPYLKEIRLRLELFLRDFDRFLYLKDPKVVEHAKKKLSLQIKCLKEHDFSTEETEAILRRAEEFREWEEQYYAKGQSTSTIVGLEDGLNEKIMDMEKNEMENDTDDDDSSVGGIQKTSRSPRTAERKKEENVTNRFIDDIQVVREFLRWMDTGYGDETLVKITDESAVKGKYTIDGSTVDIQIAGNCPQSVIYDVEESTTKWCCLSEVKHANILSKTISTEETDKLTHDFGPDLREYSTFQNSKLDKQLKKCGGVKSELKFSKEKLYPLSSEKESVRAVARAFDETRITMEAEVEATSEAEVDGIKNSNRSTGDIQIAGNSPQSAAYDIEESMAKLKAISELKPSNKFWETLSQEEIKQIAHEFGFVLRDDLDEKLKKCGGVESELKFSKGKWDPLSSEKGSIKTVAGSFDETRITMETEVEATDEVATDSESDETGETIIQLKDEKIFFQFVNDTRFIATDTFSSYEKKNATFDFKDKEVQVSFIGSQLFISTRNNVFDFHVRKRHQIDLDDEAIQTDALS